VQSGFIAAFVERREPGAQRWPTKILIHSIY
jgi:hypothetical protein